MTKRNNILHHAIIDTQNFENSPRTLIKYYYIIYYVVLYPISSEHRINARVGYVCVCVCVCVCSHRGRLGCTCARPTDRVKCTAFDVGRRRRRYKFLNFPCLNHHTHTHNFTLLHIQIHTNTYTRIIYNTIYIHGRVFVAAVIHCQHINTVYIIYIYILYLYIYIYYIR